MSATLHRKLLRNLLAMRGQAGAIAAVIAAGVMTLIISVTTLDSLSLTMERYYRDYQFAQVFADLKRAPEGVAERLRELPGINLLETRVKAPVRLEVPGFADPVRGTLVSIPDGRQPDINRLHLREGSLPAPERNDQVLISEPFSEAHGLHAGDQLVAIIQGRKETLTVSGVALSPEFVYQIGPADLMPDYERYTVLWMNRRALGNAFAMDGAFNSVVATLQAGVPAEEVVDALDELLVSYGGIGAHDRDDLTSHRFLIEELNQMRVMAVVLPAIFLSVSAFLLNVVLVRIIRTQRQEVAVLKAFGYGNGAIALHYGLLTGLIVLVGVALGLALGAWAADALAGLYMEYYRFPEMSFHLQPRVILLAVLVAGSTAAFGTWRAVSGAVALPPAEAMRPPAPENFRQGWLERSRLGRLLSQPSRIILRNLLRHRFKAVMSTLGIALSASLLLVGGFQFDAIDKLLDVQYRLVQKADVHVTFTDPTPERSLAELRHLPGAQFVEGYRAVPVRLINGRRHYRTTLLGADAEPRLRGLIDARHEAVSLPPEGMVMTDFLARHLGLRPGDRLEVEIFEGERRIVEAELAAVVAEPVGVGAYMERRALNRLMGEGPAISGAWLLIEQGQQQALFDRLGEMPRVAGIGLIGRAETTLRDYIEDTLLAMMVILVLLAGCIAFAVVYNNARIAFTERARELATLRVLGFSRREVAWILIGEISLLTLLAIPAGWLIGTGLARLLAEAMTMDLFRIPFIITPRVYALAALGVLMASALSLLLIARRLYRLDMVSALKTIE